MGDKNKPKEKQEKTQKQPSLKQKASTDTAKGRLEGGKAVQKAKVKAGLKKLKDSISKTPSSKPFSLTTKDKQLLEKAFKESLSKLNEDQIKKKIANYSITRLEKAEELQKGSSARIFAKLIEGDKEKAIDFNYKYKKGDRLRINFHGNEDAEDSFGMRTLFKHHPEVREVRLVQKNPRGKGREGVAKRRGLHGNFYLPDGYGPIFSKTEIEIVKVFTPQELEEYKKKSVTYAVGRTKRSISKTDQAFFKKQYAFVPPNPKDKKAVTDYWKQIDNATHKPRRLQPARRISDAEYVPASELEKQFKKKWDEIMAINDIQKLIDMVPEITMRPNDPLVKVPNERLRTRLRSGAALRYALFKRHAQLKGYDVYVSSGFRSRQLQERMWYQSLGRKMRKLRGEYPNLSESEIRKKAESLIARFIARPGRKGTNTGSHHASGGAIDVSVIKNGKKIRGRKFRGSRYQFNRAMQGNLRGLNRDNRQAIRMHRLMRDELLAHHFLGVNYFRETWHWNVDKDRQSGRYIYKNL